jgi:mono/diheme cytochrome c family protein
MRRRDSLAPVFLLVACALLAANAVRSAPKDWKTDSRGVLVAIAQAPVEVRAKQNPYDSQLDAILAGAKLYRRHCAECHGPEGQGTARAANLRAADVQKATPGELEWFLRNGNLRAGMPSWSGLPPQRRWQIIAYIKTLGADGAPASVHGVQDRTGK